MDDTQYSVDSVDNATSYDSMHRVPSRASADYFSKRGIRIYAADGSSASLLILFHGGGPLRKTNIAVDDDLLYLSGGVSLCCVNLAQLCVVWSADLLTGADNGIHVSSAHECVLAIGDFDVTCLDFNGGILWTAVMKDFLTSTSSIIENVLSVYDDRGLRHTLDIKTGAEKLA